MKKRYKLTPTEILVPRELITKDILPDQLQARMDELANLINLVEAALRHAPEGRLRISLQGKSRKPHYYHVTDGGNGTYIPLHNMKLIKALAQKGYNLKLLEEARKQKAQLENFIRRYATKTIEGIWTGKFYGDLVIPALTDDATYAKCWSEVPYEGKKFADDAPVLQTSGGLRVRSKSEIIIAETLTRMGVPFRYEFPRDVGDLRVYPDFTCLNVRTRKEFIWEHFGMVDDSEYAQKMMLKLTNYQNNNILAGINLIYTMETSQNPIQVENIMDRVKKFLL